MYANRQMDEQGSRLKEMQTDRDLTHSKTHTYAPLPTCVKSHRNNGKTQKGQLCF